MTQRNENGRGRREGQMKKTYIDMDELAARIGEACILNSRPPGCSARDAMRQMREIHPDSASGFERAALAAAKYIADCCNAANPGSVEVKPVIINVSEGKETTQ